MANSKVDEFRMLASINQRYLRSLDAISEPESKSLSRRTSVASKCLDENDKGTLDDVISSLEDEESSSKVCTQLLSLYLQKYIYACIEYCENMLIKPALSCNWTFISYLKKHQWTILRDSTSKMDIESNVFSKFVDLINCYYNVLDLFLSSKDSQARVKADHDFLFELATTIAEHIFNNQVSDRIISSACMILEHFHDSEKFFKSFTAVGMSHLEKQPFKSMKNKLQKTSDSFLQYVLESSVLLSTPTTYQEIILADIFSLHKDSQLDSVLENPLKLKVLKSILSYILKSSSFQLVCFWLEYLVSSFNSYMTRLIKEGGTQKSQVKFKNLKMFYMQFYSSLLQSNQLIEPHENLTIESLKKVTMADKSASHDTSYLLGFNLFFRKLRSPSNKTPHNSSEIAINLFQKNEKENKTKELACMEAIMAQRNDDKSQTGYIQLLFIHRITSYIETGIKIIAVISNREENDFIRSSYFQFFSDHYAALSYMFFYGTTQDSFYRMLLNRSTDHHVSIRVTAVSLACKILCDRNSSENKLFTEAVMSIICKRFLEDQEQVLEVAIRSLDKILATCESISPAVLPKGTLKTLAELSFGEKKPKSNEVRKHLELLYSSIIYYHILRQLNTGRVSVSRFSKMSNYSKTSSRQTKISRIVDEKTIKACISVINMVHKELSTSMTDIQASEVVKDITDLATNSLVKVLSVADQADMLSNLLSLSEEVTIRSSALRLLKSAVKYFKVEVSIARQLANKFKPNFLIEILENPKDENFHAITYIISQSLTRFGITFDGVNKREVSNFEKFLEKYLQEFWNDSLNLTKTVCDLIVTLCRLLDRTDMLAELLRRSINFVVTVRHTLQATQKNKKKGSSPTDEALLYPLKIAFIAIHLLLESTITFVEPKVALQVSRLAEEFLETENSQLTKYCLLVIYQVHKKESQDPLFSSKIQSEKRPNLFDCMELLLKNYEGSIAGLLAVSEKFVEEKKNMKVEAYVGTKSKASSRRSINSINLDPNLSKFWRANSANLFKLLEGDSQYPQPVILQVIDLVRELSLEKETQLRNSFTYLFGLCISTDQEIRAKSREALREVTDFECRLLSEPLQYSVIKQMHQSIPTNSSEKISLLSKLWNLESSLQLSHPVNTYLSGYVQDQVKLTGNPFIGNPEELYPKEYQLEISLQHKINLFELHLLLSLAYYSVHEIDKMAGLLRTYTRWIEDTLTDLQINESKLAFTVVRKCFEATKLWPLVVYCLEACITTLESEFGFKADTGFYSMTVPSALEHLQKTYSGKKTRIVKLKYQKVFEVVSSFEIADSSIFATYSQMDSSGSIEFQNVPQHEEIIKLRDSIDCMVGEVLQIEKNDWKQNRKSKKKRGNAPGAGKKLKKAGRNGRRKKDDYSDSSEDSFSYSSEDSSDYYTEASKKYTMNLRTRKRR